MAVTPLKGNALVSAAAGDLILALEAKSSSLESEVWSLRSQLDAARKFVEWCMHYGSWQGGDLDGGDVQDKAQELGLIVEVPADEAFREEYDSDTMFVVAWSIPAAVSGVGDTT